MSKIQILAELAYYDKIEFQVAADADRDFVDEETGNALEALMSFDGRIDDFYPEVEADCYTSDLKKWFSDDNYSWMWCERALSEYGWERGRTMYDLLAWGQRMAKESVYYAVIAELKELVLDVPDDEAKCIGDHCSFDDCPYMSEDDPCLFYEQD